MKWISVKDSIPDKEKYVLVFYKDSPIKQIDIGWYSLTTHMWNIGYIKTGIVTHWMPLPEPTKK